MDKILTIIIPTYNMEKYLRHCLDSLIVPNMDKVEVLVINDGSKDSSSAIGHEYQDKYPQTFRVIDKENGNYGSCVNRGLKESSGKYVKILDADDWFESDNFPSYIKILSQADVDMIISDYDIVNEHGIEFKNIKFNKVFKTPYEKFQLGDLFKEHNSRTIFQMHSIAFKKSCLDLINYRQTEGISYTDQEWIFKPLVAISNCLYIDFVIYKYVIGREGQTMESSGRVKNIIDLEKVVLSMASYYDRTKCIYEIKEYMKTILINQLHCIYREFLFSDFNNNKVFLEFDVELSNFSSVYKLLQDIYIIKGRGHYVKYWINHKRRKLPLYWKSFYNISKIIINTKNRLLNDKL